MTARSIFLDSLADAVIYVRSILNEPTQQFWLDTQLNNFIKEGTVDVCAKTMCYETIGTLALYDDLIEYSQPSKCIKVRACTFYDSVAGTYRGLNKTHPRTLNNIEPVDDGDPQMWYHFGDKIGVHPIPSGMAAAGADKIYVYHSAVTETITNLPAKYRTFAADYAAAMALLKFRKNQAAMSIYTSYLNSIKFARLDLARMEIDSKDMFKVPDMTIRGGQ